MKFGLALSSTQYVGSALTRTVRVDQPPYVRQTSRTPLPSPALQSHSNAWSMAASNPASFLPDPGPVNPEVLAQASAKLSQLVQDADTTGTQDIEMLISVGKIRGRELANELVQSVYGPGIQITSNNKSDPGGQHAYRTTQQMITAASEVPIVHDALKFLGAQLDSKTTIHIVDIETFLKNTSIDDAFKIHGVTSIGSGIDYVVDRYRFGTAHDIHFGLQYGKQTDAPSRFTPKNSLERLGVTLDNRLHIDLKAITGKALTFMPPIAYHVTKMAYGPEVGEWAAQQLKRKITDRLPVQYGLLAIEHKLATSK